MADNRQVDKVIRVEQIKLLYEALPLSILTTLMISSMMAFVEWQILDHSLLVVWFSGMLLVQIIRFALYVRFRRSDDLGNILWYRLLLFGTTLAALVWASSTLFLFPAAIEYQVFLAFVIAGVSAGAVTTLSYLRAPIILFLFLLLVPLIIRFFMQGGTVSIAMGVMVTVFFAMVSSTALRMYKNYRQNIALRYEAIFMKEALEESEEKYHHIFESAPLGIAHYSHDGEILDSNQVYQELSGLGNKERGPLNLLASGNDPEFHEAVQASLNKQNRQYQGKATVIGGDESVAIKVFLAGIGSKNNRPSDGVVIVQDITEDRRVEKAKEEFVSSISHELRTPLTSIEASLGLMDSGEVGDMPESLKPLLAISKRNSQRLISLINDILDLGKMKTGEIIVNSVKLEALPLVEDAVLIMQPYATQCGVTLRLASVVKNRCVDVDEKRFAQVLSNLISNAAKFSEKGSEVVINMAEKNDSICIAVSDTGPGIPKEFHSKIFERFTQVDASDTRSVNGSGLGLNITELLVKRMNGNISFETELNKGTTFYVEFPIIECE